MSPPPRRPLPFTFGNHMHWVDMQWLWGYQVLPDSIDDMLALCRAVGAKGNVNFDAVGYEKLAAEDPAALLRLRDAVQTGTIEVVGGSYGQPYGIFVGGESNVRQRTFGARTVRRLLGVWPRTFWEEEFDFCPQLPQILKGCGFTGASLFFQWTWHTPAVPEEAVPLVQWEGVDGTRLPTLAKTGLCLHQWPEDFDGRLEIAARSEQPALVQWLELMPSKDWMCRSEVLLPRLRELFADPRFAVEPCTAGELIARLDDGKAPVRRYTVDDVFHGITIGKNGDAVPRRSDDVEAQILAAEALTATMGLLGRPYASWDVYPAWELDEAWRELLAAQHHDNHECEGLCGSVGKASFDRARRLASDVGRRHERHLQAMVDAPPGSSLVFNPFGWPRAVPVWDEVAARVRVVRDVPARGWRVFDRASNPPEPTTQVVDGEQAMTLRRRQVVARIDRRSGALREIGSAAGAAHWEIGRLSLRVAGAPFEFPAPLVRCDTTHWGEPGAVVEWGTHPGALRADIGIEPHVDAVRVSITGSLAHHRPDPGFAGALRLELRSLSTDGHHLRADTPYAAGPVAARGEHVRKYPSGDWMTSPQWFETVRGAFTARSFVDLLRADGGGLLVAHDGSQGWFRRDDGVDVVLNARDPWDGDRHHAVVAAQFLLFPHHGLTDSQRVRLAHEVRERVRSYGVAGAGPDARWPACFAALVCEPDSVLVTAFHREHRKAFEHVEHAFGPEVRNPYVVRLVEYDGVPADVVLMVAGPCPLAAVTDLLGQVEKPLAAEPCAGPPWSPPGLVWSALRFRLRPREIATVMLDLELGRHVSRDLDEHRHVWATVHRR